MANNQYVNKVVFGNQTLIDITDSTFDENTLPLGSVAYNSAGERVEGTAIVYEVYNGLDQEESGYALDARQGPAIGALQTNVENINGVINGVPGVSVEHTEQISFSFIDGYYIEASTGKRYSRSGLSWSDFIEIPTTATSLTVKGSSNLNASGYCFYTTDNTSYPVSGSGGRLRTENDAVLTVELEIPTGAHYIAFSTKTSDVSSSGLWYTWEEVSVGNNGIIDNIDNLHETISPCIDKASQIEWTNNTRLVRTYGIYETEGYKMGELHANKGDIIIIEHDTLLAKTVVQIAQIISLANTTSYRPLVPEISSSFIEYVVPEEMDIVITVKTENLVSVQWLPMPILAKAINLQTLQGNVFSWEKISKLLNAITKPLMNRGTQTQKPFVLAHISDTHNSRQNMLAFKEFLDIYKNYLDDAIVTGDIAGSRYTDYIPLFAQTDFNQILLTIGNHDVYDHDGTAPTESYDEREYFATELETYTQYFAPSISNWNVTQPENAATNGYCYYYKDYNLGSSKGLRLIVLDPMHYNAAQHSWLVTTLEAARTAELPVVIAEHFIPSEATEPDDIQQFNTSFASLMPGMRNVYGLYFLSYVDGATRYKAADAVDSFITNGGEFVCWICGHMHFDMVGTLLSHPNQIFIAIGSANASAINAYSDMPREYGTESENLINIFSVDTYNKMIRVARVGAEFDDHMRHRGTMCIDYANKQLISSW